MNQIYRKGSKAKYVALGGIITLLNIFCLYLVSILPTNRIFFFWLSTIFLAAVIIEHGVFYAVLAFLSTAALGILIIPNKIVLVPYVIFFGYYAVIKYYIEKINNLFLEWLIKLILFNSATYVIYVITKNILIGDIESRIPLWGFFIILQFGFIIYDYFFSFMISYYKDKIRRYIGF